MSLAELKEMVDKTTPQERLFLSAYLDHLARESEPENGGDLDRRWEDMEAGKKVTLDDALKLHDELKAKGL